MLSLPTVGDQFGRYAVTDEIGRGGMGVVLGATDTVLGRRVALKVISASLGGTEEFRLRFEREAAVLARLDSPHVIAIYDYGTHAECPYIATQYVGGGDLGTLLHRSGPLPLDDALRMCAQVADALHDAHRVGVVHRDVKPTNVLVRERDDPGDDLHVYLCDFGIARTATDGLTQAGAVAGTWSYLSPECGRGAPASPASDVYAVGCLLWAALTGLPPYRGTDVQIAVAHQRAAVRQLPAVSPAAEAVNVVLRRAMAKDPAERHPDADALRRDLLDAAGRPGGDAAAPAVPAGEPGTLELLPTPVPGPPPLRPPTPTPTPTPGMPPPPYGAPAGPGGSGGSSSPRRRRTALVAGVAALVLVGGGTAVAVVARGGGDDPDPGPTTPTTVGGSDGVPSPPPSSAGAPPVTADGPIAGDLDGDGFGDLSLDVQPATGDQQTTTWRSNGTDRFVDPQTQPLQETSRFTRVWRLAGQLDDDGTTDVLRFEQPDKGADVSVTGTLSGGGTVEATLPGRGRPLDVRDGLDDVDGDGLDDLVVRSLVDDDTGTVEITTQLFDGSTFGEPSDPVTVEGEVAFAHGQLDDDGRVDLVSVRLGDSDSVTPLTVTVRPGDGAGGFGDPVVGEASLSGGSGSVLTGDIDGDGLEEVVIGDQDSRFITISALDLTDGVMTTRAGLGTIRYDPATSLGSDLAAVDVNGDRREDLVSVGLVQPGNKGRAIVAVSDGQRFVASRWLAWGQSLEPDDETGRLEILEETRW